MTLALICTALAYIIITIIGIIIITIIGTIIARLFKNTAGEVLFVMFILSSILLYIILSIKWVGFLYLFFL